MEGPSTDCAVSLLHLKVLLHVGSDAESWGSNPISVMLKKYGEIGKNRDNQSNDFL